MTDRRICQEIEEMLPAYALDSLTPDEREYVETHIAGCPDCQQAAEEYAVVAQGLLHLPPAHDPPAELRQRVLGSIEEEAQPLMQRLAVFWQQPAMSRVAVGAAIVALILINISLLIGLNSLTQQQRQLQEKVDRNQTAMAVLTYPDTKVVDFNNDLVFGTVVYDPTRPIIVLYAWGLEPLPSDQTYQGWLYDEAAPISAGTFAAERGGQFSVVLLRAPQTINQFTAFEVTIEAGDGSQRPGDKDILSVDFQDANQGRN